jgi:hypothetical protein
MYDFSSEKLLDREQVRRRLERMTDDQLRRWGASARRCAHCSALAGPTGQRQLSRRGTANKQARPYNLAHAEFKRCVLYRELSAYRGATAALAPHLA